MDKSESLTKPKNKPANQRKKSKLKTEPECIIIKREKKWGAEGESDVSEEEEDNEIHKDAEITSRKSWRSQKGLCRVCLKEGNYFSMNHQNVCDLFQASYADVLRTTLGLILSTKVPQLICERCCNRLKDAYVLKNQVLNAELFLNHQNFDKYNDYNFKTEDKVNKVKSNDSDADSELDNFPVCIKSETEEKFTVKIEPPVTVSVTCKHCHKKFKSKERQEQHFERFHLGCTKCKMKFDSMEAKDAHVLKNHPYKCEVCNKSFPRSEHRKRHAIMTHGRKCKLCDKDFTTLREMLKHKAEVHNAPREQCNICDSVFYLNRDLIRHQRKVHMNERNAPCPQCDYVAFDAAHLSKHLFKHSEKVLACRFCSKMFARRSNLNSHERIHTGDKRQVCKYCGEAFVQRASLKYHLEKHHPGDFY